MDGWVAKVVPALSCYARLRLNERAADEWREGLRLQDTVWIRMSFMPRAPRHSSRTHLDNADTTSRPNSTGRARP